MKNSTHLPLRQQISQELQRLSSALRTYTSPKGERLAPFQLKPSQRMSQNEVPVYSWKVLVAEDGTVFVPATSRTIPATHEGKPDMEQLVDEILHQKF